MMRIFLITAFLSTVAFGGKWSDPVALVGKTISDKGPCTHGVLKGSCNITLKNFKFDKIMSRFSFPKWSLLFDMDNELNGHVGYNVGNHIGDGIEITYHASNCYCYDYDLDGSKIDYDFRKEHVDGFLNFETNEKTTIKIIFENCTGVFEVFGPKNKNISFSGDFDVWDGMSEKMKNAFHVVFHNSDDE